MNKLEVKIMTKYLVKIYNCGKLEDARILEETDKIQLADYYIQDNQLWGEVWAETDEEELYYEKVIICLKVKAELGLNEETILDIVRYRRDEKTIEEYLDLDLIDFEVTNVNGYAAEDILNYRQIEAIKKEIAESIELDYINDEAGVKIVIQEYERSGRRGIPKEIAEQFSKETVQKVKDFVKNRKVRFADCSDIQIRAALELASRNLSFEGCLYLPKMSEEDLATLITAANHGYDVMSMLDAKSTPTLVMIELKLIAAALDRGHLEVIDQFSKMDFYDRESLTEVINDGAYDPIYVDQRVLKSGIGIKTIYTFIKSGAGIERVKEFLENSTSATDFRAYMLCEEFLATDAVNGKKMIEHLTKSLRLTELATDTRKYRAIFKLMQNDAVDADKILAVSDSLDDFHAEQILYDYENGRDFFRYITYDKIKQGLSDEEFRVSQFLLRNQIFKALELYRDNVEYDWVVSEYHLETAVRFEMYEDYIFDSSLSSEESRALARVLQQWDREAAAKAKDLFNNRANLDRSFVEAVEELIYKD